MAKIIAADEAPCVSKLIEFNRWRRGRQLQMPDTYVSGRAIDAAVVSIRRYRMALALMLSAGLPPQLETIARDALDAGAAEV